MKLNVVSRWTVGLVLALIWLATPSTAMAAKRVTSPIKLKPEGDVVEMFAAMGTGDIEVTIIPKDATVATVFFKNKTDRPLAIALPEAFAAVPVAAQFCCGGGCGGGAGGGAGGGGGGNQAGGGGFGGGGGGGGLGGGGGGGGGFFNVAADRVGKVKIAMVCLEHGKRDPNPRVKYVIKPIESFTDKGDVIEICKMLGRGQLSQNIAQAAAWHSANGLSWAELANKDRVYLRRSNYREKYFSRQELMIALQATQFASQRAKDHPVPTLPEKQDSLSQQ